MLAPQRHDRALLHHVIFDELCQGIVSDQSRSAVTRVIERLAAQGAEGVILGCTELEMLVGAGDSPIPAFPTTRLHVDAAVEAALHKGDHRPG